jgi:hypothetical protein
MFEDETSSLFHFTANLRIKLGPPFPTADVKTQLIAVLSDKRGMK